MVTCLRGQTQSDLKTHLSAFETSVENLKHDLKYLSRDLQPFAGSFRLKTSS